MSTTTLKRSVDGQSLTADPPDFQPLADGLRRRLEARVGLQPYTELFLVEPGVKVNGKYYQECPVDGEDVACDLEDGKRLLHLPAGQRPTAHRAKDTIALLRCETLSFIGPELWPANSPDLNPVDYRIWGLIQERVYSTRQQYGTSTS